MSAAEHARVADMLAELADDLERWADSATEVSDMENTPVLTGAAARSRALAFHQAARVVRERAADFRDAS